MAECDPSRCPTGLAYQQVSLSLAEIKKQTADTHKVVTDQAVTMNQIASMQKEFRELKTDNKKDHDEFFSRLRIVELSNTKKITVKDVLYYFGGVIAAVGGIIMFIKVVTGH